MILFNKSCLCCEGESNFPHRNECGKLPNDHNMETKEERILPTGKGVSLIKDKWIDFKTAGYEYQTASINAKSTAQVNCIT